MPNEDPSSDTLRELQLVGLTKEEAKAYIPLVQNVEITAAGVNLRQKSPRKIATTRGGVSVE